MKKILSDLKVLCLYSPILYKLTYALGIAKGDICNQQTVLCMEGFPSSANSYSLNLARMVAAPEAIASHCHAVANMRMAMARKIPVIFISREPMGAISSHMTRHGKSKYNACRTYKSLYRFAVAHRDQISIADFDEITRNPDGLIQLTCDLLNLEYVEGEYQDADGRVKAHIKAYEGNVLQTSGFHGLLPNPEKESAKEKAKAELMEDADFEECEALYRTLISGAADGR